MLEVSTAPNLRDVGPDKLSQLTANTSPFHDPEWLQVLDSAGVGRVAGDGVELKHLLLWDEANLVGLCPYLEVPGRAARTDYSLGGCFFPHQAARDDSVDNWSQSLVGALVRELQGAWQGVLGGVGVDMDGWLAAVAAPGVYGGIAALPGHEVAVAERVVDALEELADERNRLAVIYGLERQETHLNHELTRRNWQRNYWDLVTALDLPGDTFDDYLASMSQTKRARVRRDYRKVGKLGLSLETTETPPAAPQVMSTMYDDVMVGPDRAHQPFDAECWAALARRTPSKMRFFGGYRDGELIAFSCGLTNSPDSIVWCYGASSENHVPTLYFLLTYYEPIREAYKQGSDRIWLGKGSYQAKIFRGAHPEPLYAYIHYPSRRSKLLLKPQVDAMTRLTERMDKKMIAALPAQKHAEQSAWG